MRRKLKPSTRMKSRKPEAKSRKRYSYADFLKFPDDGNRHEIVEGEWIMTPPPTFNHQRVVANILHILESHVRSRNLGDVLASPVGVELSRHDVVQPDVLFLSGRRSSVARADGLHGAPDLVVEVLSPSTAGIDRLRKHRAYERAGVREYWIVDPQSLSVEVVEFGRARRTRVLKEGQSFESAVLPGLTVKLADIFSRLR